jgi:glyoxylase I family protein
MKFHHIAIIVSDHKKSLDFYQNVLGFKLIHEVYRHERKSYKLDLEREGMRIEMFTFIDAPKRPSYPEAIGLRHLAFEVDDLEEWHLKLKGLIKVEEIKLDSFTGKKFFFFPDPDNLPIEFYES